MTGIALKKDKSFDFDKINNYSLSIRIDTNGLSFCIYDYFQIKYLAASSIAYSKKVTNYSDLYDEVKKVFDSNSILNHEYKSVKVCFVTNKFTLIPDDYFVKEEIKEYFCFNNYLSENEELHFNHVESLSGNVIFSIPCDITTFFINRFKSKVQFYSQISSLSEKSFARNAQKRFSLYVNINNNCFDVIIKKSNSILFCNSFEHTNYKDFLYFVLATVKSFKIGKRESEVIVSGDVNEESLYVKELKRYLGNVELEDLPQLFSYSKILQGVHPNFFSNLYYLVNCE